MSSKQQEKQLEIQLHDNLIENEYMKSKWTNELVVVKRNLIRARR